MAVRRNNLNTTILMDTGYNTITSTGITVDAGLFVDAEEYLGQAKDLFKKCQGILNQTDVTLGSSLFSQLKTKFQDSDTSITNLLNKIEVVKENLMTIDQTFSGEYMQKKIKKLNEYSKIDVSKLSEEEKAEYTQNINNCVKDIDFYILYLLERCKENGQLTPEIEELFEQEYGTTYEYQKAKCEQYDILDKMAGKDKLSDEYIELYQEYVEISKNMILCEPSLDEAARQIKLKELETQSTEYLKSIEQAKKDKKFQQQSEELYLLNLKKSYNNGLLHPFVESEIDDAILNLRVEMGDPAAIEYVNMSGFEKALQYAGTVCLSTVEGFLDLGEGIVDAGIYVAGGVSSIFVGNNDWADTAIAYDVSGNLYDWTVDAVGINSEIAYGSAKSIGNFAGGGLGYYALSAVPYVGPVLCALAGAGKKMEENMNYQLETTGKIDDGEVLLNSALGALEGFAAGKAAGSMREGIKNFSQIKGVVSKEGISSVVNSAGKISQQAAIRTFTEADTWIEAAAVIADDVYAGFSTGEWDFGRMGAEALGVIGENFIGNFGSEALGNYQREFAAQKTEWNDNFENMTPEQKSKYWEDYFNSEYGIDNVTKTSGIDIEGSNGVFVDLNAAYTNGVMEDFIDIMQPENMASNNEYKRIVAPEITSKGEFITYAKTLGYSDDAINAYMKQIRSDADWNFSSGVAIEVAIADEFFKTDSVEMEKITGISKDTWEGYSPKEKSDFITANIDNAAYNAKLNKSFSDSAETLRQTKLAYEKGYYSITPDEVIIRRMDAKNGVYTSAKKVIINGVDYTTIFPGCDEFITDSGLYNYVKDLTGLTDADIVSYAKSTGFNYSSDIEAMAHYLTGNEVYIRGTIYQDATVGSKNLVRFGSIGPTSQIYSFSIDGGKTYMTEALSFDVSNSQYYYWDKTTKSNVYVLAENIDFTKTYNTSGGAYTLLSTDQEIAAKFPECCTMKDGKLVITNMELFGEKVLSGVPLTSQNGVYKITYNVPLGSCSMPSVNNGQMYTDFGVPGGHLLSGEVETVITGTNISGYLTNNGSSNVYSGDFSGITDDGKIFNVELITTTGGGK